MAVKSVKKEIAGGIERSAQKRVEVAGAHENRQNSITTRQKITALRLR
ncbi:MAG: hypothetical protein ACLQU2_34120 [Candidatus Binataceae bacterium]